jgi:Cytochrome domain of cellobiose dehydrogenase
MGSIRIWSTNVREFNIRNVARSNHRRRIPSLRNVLALHFFFVRADHTPFFSGHSEPNVYLGPTISVLSSNITSNSFIAELAISNATTWMNSGSLDIGSSSASVIWALGTSPPSDPTNPSSDFEQHQYQGTFSIDMQSAQVDQSTSSGNGSSNSNSTEPAGPGSPTIGTLPAAPQITGAASSSSGFSFGLSPRDKVPLQNVK